MALTGAPAIPMPGARDAARPRPETPERAYWAVLADGAATRAMEVLAGGAVLTALAVALGADGTLLGLLLVALPALAQAAQVAGVHWIRRSGRVKPLCLGLVLPARLLLLAAAAVPYVLTGSVAALALVPLVLVSGLFANASGVAWGVWMNELLPRERLGRFYALRLGIMTLSGLVALAASAWWLGDRQGDAHALALVFAVGALAGLVGAVFISRIPARVHVPAPGSTGNIVSAFRSAHAYRRALPGFIALTTGLHLFVPFGVAMLLIGGGYPESTTLLLVAWSQVVALVAFPVLGWLSDRARSAAATGVAVRVAGRRFALGPRLVDPLGLVRTLSGHGAVAAVGAGTLAAAAVLWMVASNAGYPILLVLAIYTLNGLGTAAVDLAIGNLQMWLAPRGHAPALFAGTALIRAVAAAGAGLFAGAMLSRTAAGDPLVWAAGGAFLAAAAVLLARAGREAPPVETQPAREASPTIAR
ncbi:MAG TPA: MFS transporter [Candidatus Thermoplasmatota archaeon]|nr:MFS transporter [Candidatus Thermoplasmatota archaeon]